MYSLFDVLFKLRWISENFVQEPVRYSTLDRAVLVDDSWVKMPPECTPVSPPTLAIWHESKVDVRSNADIAISKYLPAHNLK